MPEPGIRFHYAGHFSGRSLVGAHAHDGEELVLVVRGEADVRFDGYGTFHAGPGDVYVTPPGVRHAQRNTADCETLYVVLHRSDLACCRELRVVPTGGDTLVQCWFEDLLQLRPDADLECAAALTGAILARLAMLERSGIDRKELHPVLREAMTYFSAHVSLPFTMTELAGHCRTSPSYLNTLFRRRFGCGPQAYFTGRRMRLARRMLADRTLSLKEVAERSGYPDVSYFIRCFRKFYGITPGACRREG